MHRRPLHLTLLVAGLALAGCAGQADAEPAEKPPPSRIVLSDADLAACDKARRAGEAINTALDKGTTHTGGSIADELTVIQADLDAAAKAAQSDEPRDLIEAASAQVTLVVDDLYTNNTWNEPAVTALLSAVDGYNEWCWRR